MSRALRWGRVAARAATRVAPLRRAVRGAAMRGYVPDAVWRRLPPNQYGFEVPLPGGATFTYAVDNQDPFVRELFWRGLHSAEGASVAAFHECARSADVVVDVGAHTGLYTLTALAAMATTRVIAFEPVAANVAMLEANLVANGWQDRCEIRAQAVSNESGTIQVHVPHGDHPMSASLDVRGFRGLAGELVDVDVTTLDAALPPDAVVDVVKIDVEGFEDRVLEGMTATLERCRPVAMVECNPDGPVKNVETILRSFGYRFRLLDGTSRPLTDRIVPDASEIYRNFLCVPDPDRRS